MSSTVAKYGTVTSIPNMFDTLESYLLKTEKQIKELQGYIAKYVDGQLKVQDETIRSLE